MAEHTSSSNTPTVVIAHGSWHTPSHYKTLISALEKTGVQTYCPHLPSCAIDKPPYASLPEDTQTIRNAVTRLSDQGRKIIVLNHSYGGVVGTNALKNLSYKARKDEGKPGGVIHLIYMAAFTTLPGTNLLSASGGQVPPWIIESPPSNPADDDENRTNWTITMKDERNSFYALLSEEDATYWLGKCVSCPRQVLTDSTEYAAFMDIESTYLVCEGDTNLTPEIQRGIMEGILRNPAWCKDRETVREAICPGDHCAMISCPERVTEVIKETWDYALASAGRK